MAQLIESFPRSMWAKAHGLVSVLLSITNQPNFRSSSCHALLLNRPGSTFLITLRRFTQFLFQPIRFAIGLHPGLPETALPQWSRGLHRSMVTRCYKPLVEASGYRICLLGSPDTSGYGISRSWRWVRKLSACPPRCIRTRTLRTHQKDPSVHLVGSASEVRMASVQKASHWAFSRSWASAPQ